MQPNITSHTGRKQSNPPLCPGCKRACKPEATWPGANYCRGQVLLPLIEALPGLSTWELPLESGLSYQDASRGLAKLREYNAVRFEPEERAGKGGIRYRHYPATGTPGYAQFLNAAVMCQEVARNGGR